MMFLNVIEILKKTFYNFTEDSNGKKYSGIKLIRLTIKENCFLQEMNLLLIVRIADLGYPVIHLLEHVWKVSINMMLNNICITNSYLVML